MKNLLLLLAALVVAGGGASAQINLAAAGYPTSPIGTDTLKVTTAASTYPSFAAATNATWDLTTVTDSTAVIQDYIIPASSPAAFADSSLHSFLGYAYKGNIQLALTSPGLMDYGIDIMGSTNPTGTAGDTITIPTQNDVFTAARTVIAFPATMSSSWSSSYTQTINYFLSYVVSSIPVFLHTPGTVKGFSTEKDTVIGWGQMRVKTLSGGASGYVNVLQVRTMITTVDSFYLNGTTTDPLLPSLLPLLGATQGQVTKTYSQSFYRLDNIVPLASVRFADSANTMPTQVTTNVQRLPAPAGVPAIAGAAGIKVYPNPVTGNMITIAAPATTGPCSYELTDITGRKVQEGVLATGSANAQVSIVASVLNGVYFLKVNNNGNTVSVSAVEVKR